MVRGRGETGNVGLDHGVTDRGAEGDVADVCEDGRGKGFEGCGTVEEVKGGGLKEGDEVSFQGCFWQFEACVTELAIDMENKVRSLRFI